MSSIPAEPARPTQNFRTQQVIRILLGVLLAFGAINAFGGGWYGLSGAKDIPTEWLAGSPFHNYSIPSLILLIVVGGAFAVGAFAVSTRAPFARTAALAAGAIVLIWLMVQVAIIGPVSWMQPVTAAVGLLILVLGWWIDPRATRRA